MNPVNKFDEVFNSRLGNFEAKYDPSELNADWNRMSNNLSATQQAPANNVGAHVGKAVFSAGKIAGIAGIAAVITTAAVLIFNSPKENNVSTQSSVNKIESNTTDLNSVEEKSVTSKQVVSNGESDQKNAHVYQQSKKIVVGRQVTGNSTQTDKNIFSEITPTSNNNIQPPHNNNGSAITPPSKVEQKIIRLNLSVSAATVCKGDHISIANLDPSQKNIVVSWGSDKPKETFSENVTHSFSKTGHYPVQISNGSSSATYTINVIEKPQVHFNANQTGNLTYYFNNLTEAADRYSWDYGDGSIKEYKLSPVHRFSDTGTYKVTLIASNQTGCADTSVQKIYVTRYTEPEVHNIFTPNGDGVNDDFKFLTGKQTTYFELTIMSRNGQTVFSTSDPNEAWNGNLQNIGNACNAGTYLYVIRYKYLGEEKTFDKSGILELRR